MSPEVMLFSDSHGARFVDRRDAGEGRLSAPVATSNSLTITGNATLVLAVTSNAGTWTLSNAPTIALLPEPPTAIALAPASSVQITVEQGVSKREIRHASE